MHACMLIWRIKMPILMALNFGHRRPRAAQPLSSGPDPGRFSDFSFSLDCCCIQRVGEVVEVRSRGPLFLKTVKTEGTPYILRGNGRKCRHPSTFWPYLCGCRSGNRRRNFVRLKTKKRHRNSLTTQQLNSVTMIRKNSSGLDINY